MLGGLGRSVGEGRSGVEPMIGFLPGSRASRRLVSVILYLSLFFKRHRDEYYRRLNAVRTDGDGEGWLDFFLDGVATIADEAVASARELFSLGKSGKPWLGLCGKTPSARPA